MALNNAIRRAASRLGQRYLHDIHILAAAVNPPKLLRRPKEDQKLITALNFEVEHTVESSGYYKKKPKGIFPFEIEDNAGQKTITLKREIKGETINVEVHMSDLLTCKEEDDEEGAGTRNQLSIPLVVRVLKGNGPSLKFVCTAYPDKIAIDSLSIKDPKNSDDQNAYEGPHFANLSWNMQKAFHEYLRIRGINPCITNFLHGYMITKDTREYITWLKNFKGFVEAY